VENKKKFQICKEIIGTTNKTTVMIQNIPNKYNKDSMLELINQNFRGKYDFFYLPIDLKFQCNVGYAFINFLDVESLEKFYVQFHNKKWPMFNSEKICHLSYARLQGW
jgi:RNA recognition motif-containing protein